MQRFKNILVLASSEGATRSLIEDASALAQRNDAAVTLFDVVEPLPKRRRFHTSEGRTMDLQALLEANRREELERFAGEVARVPIAVDVTSGTGFVEVIERAAAHGHDLIIVAPDRTRSRLGLAGAPTTMHLLRKSPVPVWVNTGGSSLRPDVAVAVGPVDEEARHDSLNTTLLELGSSLAAIRGGRLHVIHAWRLEGESRLRKGRVTPPSDVVDDLVDEAHGEAETGLKLLLESVPMPDIPREIHLQKGDPGDVILRIARETRPGVVVMGTLARTGLPGVIMGNNAERVLGTIDASILAVKPPGFVSPVSR